MAEIQAEEFISFLTEFINESDRAAVVLGASKLDYLLCCLINKVLFSPQNRNDDELLDEEGQAGALGSFGANINIAYRLGLIDESFKNSLHLIRKIRNRCAHEIEGCRLNSSPLRNQVGTLIAPYKKLDKFSEGVKLIEEYTEGRVKGSAAKFRVTLAMITARFEWAIKKAQPIVPAKPLISINEG